MPETDSGSIGESGPTDYVCNVKQVCRKDTIALNQSIGDWYTHAATLPCSAAAIFSTAAVTADS
jgi:hypothetical protein